MNDLSNALLTALLRISYLVQLGFVRTTLSVIRFIRAHKSMMWVTYFVVTLGPPIVLGVLLYFIILELAEWWFVG